MILPSAITVTSVLADKPFSMSDIFGVTIIRYVTQGIRCEIVKELF